MSYGGGVRARVWIALVWLALAGIGCGAAPGRVEEPAAPTIEAAVPAPALPTSEGPTSEGTIARSALDAWLDAGLGRFLGHVTTEPHLDGGRFVGHRLTALRGSIFEGIDLSPGDTLVRVNGAPIERPEQALRVWNELRVASELTLEVLREGQPRRLRFAIVDDAPAE